MYRTKSLGIIYDQYIQSYRPVYEIIEDHQFKNQHNTFQSNRTYTQNKQKINQQNKIKMSNQIKGIMKAQQIDARVKSPQPRLNHQSSLRKINQNNFLVSPRSLKKATQTYHKHQTNNKQFNYAKTYASSDWNSSGNIWQQSVKKDSVLSQQYIPNSQMYRLLNELKLRINNKYTSHEYVNQLNNDITHLSSTIYNKNFKILNLQQQLIRSQQQLSKAREEIMINNNNKYHLDYGKQARNKLRDEIDNLKQSYEILLDRVQNQLNHQFSKEESIKSSNQQQFKQQIKENMNR